MTQGRSACRAHGERAPLVRWTGLGESDRAEVRQTGRGESGGCAVRDRLVLVNLSSG